MSIKFLVSDDDDLIWDIDDHSEPITEQQAMLVVLRRMAGSLGAIADALHNISNEGQSKSAAAKPRKPKVAAKRKAKR